MAAEHSVKVDTTYVVLARNADHGDIWHQIGNVNARSSDAAVKKTAETAGGGVYVAVPVRSWQPAKITPRVTTTFDVEEVK